MSVNTQACGALKFYKRYGQPALTGQFVRFRLATLCRGTSASKFCSLTKPLNRLLVGTFLVLTVGCSVMDKSNTFTLTADMPPGFAYMATVSYSPVPGQNCKLEKRDNLKPQFNREWQKVYKPDSLIEIHRTRKGCELELRRIDLEINAAYGKELGDFSTDYGRIVVATYLDPRDKGIFNADGESEFFGQCQWWFRTVGPERYLIKLLNCKSTDAHGDVKKYRPFAAYTRDQLPGKTVKLTIKLAEKERPAIGDTWVEVPGGWKRCMGDNFEDQYAFCYGNYTDFSTFKMVDGRTCTIYPGCTENKEFTP